MSYGFKPIGQYLEDTLNDVPSVTPTQTFGINAIHKFFHPFNNKGVIDEIIEARKRERKIQQKLMADEWGLKVIMGVPTDADAPSTNRPKDGLLITTPTESVYFRVFPDYDYSDHAVYFDWRDVYAKIIYLEVTYEGQPRFSVVKGYGERLKALLLKQPQFPECADLVCGGGGGEIVRRRVRGEWKWYFECTMLCGHRGCQFKVTVIVDLSQFQRTPPLIYCWLQFGDREKLHASDTSWREKLHAFRWRSSERIEGIRSR
eukprot:974843_1